MLLILTGHETRGEQWVGETHYVGFYKIVTPQTVDRVRGLEASGCVVLGAPVFEPEDIDRIGRCFNKSYGEAVTSLLKGMRQVGTARRQA